MVKWPLVTSLAKRKQDNKVIELLFITKVAFGPRSLDTFARGPSSNTLATYTCRPKTSVFHVTDMEVRATICIPALDHTSEILETIEEMCTREYINVAITEHRERMQVPLVSKRCRDSAVIMLPVVSVNERRGKLGIGM